jgi:hypothetical protein
MPQTKSTTPTPEQELQAALQQCQVTNALLLASWLAALLGLIFMSVYWQQLTDINEDKLVAALADRVEKNSDEIVAEVEVLAAKTAPTISQTFYRQIKSDLPVYARAVEEQSGELVQDLESDFLKISEAQWDRYLNIHWQVLRDEFPEITDEKTLDRMKNEFKQAYRKLIQRYYIDDFRRQAKKTAALWAKVEPVAPPKGPDSLEDQLLDYFVSWSTENLVDVAEKQAVGDGG